VIKIGGTTLEAGSPALWKAIASVSREREGGVVLVHGGGKAVDRHLERIGLSTQRREGIRITPADQIDEIVGVLAGRVNKSLVGSLNTVGARAVGLCLGDGGVVRTVKTTRFAFDPGRVGECDTAAHGSASLLRLLLRERYLPVIASIGLDDAGHFLNVNADDAGAGLAAALGASALVLLTDVRGVLDGSKRIVHELTPSRIEQLIASGEVSGGMIPKVRAAAAVVTESGVPVVILSGDDGSLAEFLAGNIVGTRIVPEGA